MQIKNARATERQLEQIKPAAQTNIAGGHNSQPEWIRPVPKKHRARFSCCVLALVDLLRMTFSGIAAFPLAGITLLN